MKKNIFHPVVALVLVLTILFGCAVEKRHYRKGYSISWNKQRSVKDEVQKEDVEHPMIDHLTVREISSVALHSMKEPNIEKLEPEKGNNLWVKEKEVRTLQGHKFQPTQKSKLAILYCDTIILRNGDRIVAKIGSRSADEIIYQKCGSELGSKRFLSKSEIASINYHDGRSEVINSSSKNGDSNDKESSNNSEYGKSQLIALILVLLIGVLGVHRFYLGYPVVGILFILTFGFCGIGVLVDLILIATGSLKPRDREYDEVF